jgi:hypothetical protein
MILKIELYVDGDFKEGVKNKVKDYQEELNNCLNADASTGKLLQLETFLNSTTNSYEFLSKQEILERMRTKGK